PLRSHIHPGKSNKITICLITGYKQVVDKVTVNGADTQISVQDANIALAKNVGFALYYTLGHAYFNIPVRHFGWYRAGNENAKDAIFDWNKVKVGDFGMVRNHAYNIKVDKIIGLANGIGGDEVELVPPSSETNYYVSYQVHILKWAVVPTQNVNL
ncbi:MAG: Mfa1 fimbrilin C-terminal domain-containing protein, partial [Muribaculaceae bacterium]|nr:Mfa1 fimbrilin C-terminal domain-containing protein [Muribaculaceae bacterium]